MIGTPWEVRMARGVAARLAAGAAMSAPTITASPVDGWMLSGGSVMFTVVATGSPVLTYVWQVSADGGATWQPVTASPVYSGVTTATLTLTAPAPALRGARYRAVVTNSAGSAMSEAATLRVVPARMFTTLAGLAASGSADGVGTAARFSGPTGVAVDAAGHVYVADTDNHVIRRIAPDGSVITLAGLAGSSGHSDGTGVAARFFNPRGVAVDAAFNVYVADSNNGRIRKVTPGGTVTTVTSGLSTPVGVAVDPAGTLYVAELWGQTIRQITADGVVTTLAGRFRPESCRKSRWRNAPADWLTTLLRYAACDQCSFTRNAASS